MMMLAIPAGISPHFNCPSDQEDPRKILAILSLPAEPLPELTLDNVRAELEKQGIQHTEIVMRQVIVETGWLKCTHCSLVSNNLFGFMTKNGYLKFEHWTESVAYYKKWQDSYYKGGDYYAFLDKIGYARATYASYLRSLY
jgi:hypothetical protein